MLEPSSKIISRLLAVAIGITAFTGTVCLFETSVSAQQTAVTPAMLSQPVASSADLLAKADAKLTEARKAIAAKDIATAESILAELQSQSISYPAKSDKPEYVLMLVSQYKLLVESERRNGADEAYRRGYARLMLMQAEAFYRKNELGLASQLVEEAQKQNVLYNEEDKQRGLEPGVMIRKIESARANQRASQRTAVVADVATQQQMSSAARRELAQSQQMLLQARQQLQVGNLDDAERIARLAINPNVPESLYPQGSDTPNRIIREVYTRRQNAAAGVAVPVVPMGTVASNALYDTRTDQTLIRQTRTNPNDSQFVQSQQQRQMTQPTLAPSAGNMPQLQQQPQRQQSLVEQAARSQQVLYYQVTSEVLHQISEANRVVAEKQDPDNALKILEQARVRVENSALDQQAKAQLQRNINTAVENTVRYTQRNAAMIELNQQNAEVRTERQAAQEEMLNVQKQLKAYVAETNKALEEGRYEDARIIAKKAKQIAPQDPTADLLAVTTDLHANIAISKQIQKEKAEAVNYALTDVDRASIIPRFDVSPLSMNADRWNVVKNRKGNDDLLSLRPESEQKIIKSLELPVSLNVAEPMSLSQFINLLKGQTGVPIVMDIASMRMVDVTPDAMISLTLSQDVKLRNALSLVLQQVGLSYVVEHEVLKITSSQASRGKLITKIHYVGDLVQRIPNFDGTNSNSLDASYEKGMRLASSATGVGRYKNQLAMADSSVSSIAVDGSRVPDHVNAQTTMPFSSGSGSPYGIGGNGAYPPGTLSNGMVPNAFGGNMADFSQLIDLITAVVDPTSWEDNDEVNIMQYYNNLSLIIRQTEDAHAEIVELLNQLRKLNDLQITVEVRFITLNDNFFERMGVSFGMNFPNGSARARSNPDYVSPLTDDTGTAADSTASNRQWVSNRPANNATVGLSAPNVFTANFDIPVTQGSYNLGIPQFGGFDPSAGISMGFAIMSDIEAQFFINAAEGDNRTNIMQAPKVTLFNGQYGTVSDTVERPFVVSQIPVVGDFAAAYQPVISIIHEGQRMSVQGTVSNNRQYVRLTLNPSITQITKVDTFKFSGEEDFTETTSASKTGNDNAAASTDEKSAGSTRRAISSGVTVQQPIVSELNVSTTVSVPDGGTILLGGIKRLSEGRNEYGTPILSKLPYISRLFSNTSIGRETQSILMIVTPRIIIQEEEEEALTGHVF